MGVLDLDARRAEANDEPHQLTLGGETYELPARVPLAFVEELSNNRFYEAIALLFGADNAEPVFALLSAEDLDVIAKDLYDMGGDGVGKASASSSSSNRAGRRSKRTSNGSTAST